ncbi:lytic transglycosylase domain-containing protein [Rhodovulum sp. DZ06]|uniref:lytic transglycosylase domain-containing protein n=1 Tax=Rhodovulum sp. DZ06 TaxID=3425126 RepID=UPI003D338628
MTPESAAPAADARAARAAPRGRALRAAASAGLALALAFAVPAAAKVARPSPSEAASVAAMVQAANGGEIDALRALAAAASDPAARALADWLSLREGTPSWSDYAAFLADHSGWPGASRLRAEAERAMPPNLPAGAIRRFFEAEAPRTGIGAFALSRALAAAGDRAAAEAEAARAWTELSLTPSEEDALLAAHPQTLSKLHWQRLDMLLWRGLAGEAERAAARLGPAEQALARARSGLNARARGVDGLVAAVPARYADDPGLAWERFDWRWSRGLRDGAEEMLLERSASAAALGRPEVWADRRRILARQAQRDGQYAHAYRIASSHHLSEGSDYADLEWLSGWLSLRFLDRPDRALTHFERFAAAVETPISLGRAGYWRGRALDALGRTADAREAYAAAALHQTSFYGQLAAEKLGGAPDPVLIAEYPVPHMPEVEFGPPHLMRAALLLHAAGEDRLARWFFLSLAGEARGETQFAALAGLGLEIGRPDIAVRTAKMAAREGGLLPAAYYPVTELARHDGPVPVALALAVARQETELNPRAISPAGARGLMQLMPGTAKLVAGKLDIPYGFNRLTEDWRYNATLGRTYLSWLIEEFGAYPLVAAGYNAGPHRVRTWLERYGDPRGRGVEAMVDWMETIPFRETRNYVQRVIEGMHVYEVRLAGAPKPPRMAALLGE